VVIVYAMVGLLWIALSGRVLEAFVPDPHLRDRLELLKGAAYVLVTSVLLYELVRRSQSRLLTFGTEIRAAVESMADGVLVIDATGIVEANRAAVELLGASSKQDVLGDLESLVQRFRLRSTDGAPLGTSDLAVLAASRGARSARDTLLRRLDGRDIVVSVSAAPVVAPGDTSLVVAVLRDVSHAHRLETMRDEFLATAAHELKTPLAVVKAYAQLVQRRVPAEAPALAVVQRQVDRMTRLVQHLLESSRLRLDPGTGARERFDLSLLVSEVIDRIRETDAGHQLTLVAPGPISVQGDRDRIGRVVQSLLDNAVRFSPRGGPIEARVLLGADEAEVSVTDHGLGIPLDRQERIFERYYRAHAGTAEDYGGLGLSLDMSREIVTRHGGRIWFESTPGQGSTFHFTLPAGKEPEP
jgi:signal transduction histidine kinase